MPADKPRPHPGRTPAQRRALDAIGCGNFSPRMTDRTRESLLDDGLIVHAGDQEVGQDRLGTHYRKLYEMPIPVHMAWCAAVGHSVTDEDIEAAIGGEHG